ncbi:hypothetical protein O181_121065, partial [Austropuccinia psidii MF-1]|nr:hypothetical protein [Austropuccinia psidii MF-1]
ILALDLKSFAKHAGRNSIRADDVKLVARKSNALLELLNEELQRFELASTNSTTNTSKPKSKPRSKRPKVLNHPNPPETDRTKAFLPNTHLPRAKERMNYILNDKEPQVAHNMNRIIYWFGPAFEQERRKDRKLMTRR